MAGLAFCAEDSFKKEEKFPCFFCAEELEVKEGIDRSFPPPPTLNGDIKEQANWKQNLLLLSELP